MMAMFPYKPTTFEGPSWQYPCPVSPPTPVAAHDAVSQAQPAPQPETVVAAIQPTRDLGAMLQQTQAQLSNLLSQMGSAQPLGLPGDSEHMVPVPPSRTQVCSPPSPGQLPESWPTLSATMSFPERSLTLGNGIILQFTAESVPDPPAVSFANNIPRLNSMWDDKTDYWCGTSPLVVSGHPIPVSYWPEMYKYGKKDQWKGTKAKWFEWKVSSCCHVGLY
jgi:hypothetical protein